MQNRYVGDLGDFGKYGMLRALAKGRRLGVVWYLTPDEDHNADGKHVAYLDPSERNRRRFRGSDADLYDLLGAIVGGDDRSVRAVRERGVLPFDTAYYEEPLTYNGMPVIGPSAIAGRLDRRAGWLRGALEATAGCAVVFADPDNGIECGRRAHERLGPKHAHFAELAAFIARGQCLVVYHHLDRSAPAPTQISRALDRLTCAADATTTPLALHYRRGTARACLVVPSPTDDGVLAARARRFVAGPWGAHFAMIPNTNRPLDAAS